MSGKNLFNSVQMKSPKSNVFDLSHDVKLSMNMGDLVPTMFLDCTPGDKFNLGCDSLTRLAPMLAPMMHRVDITQHYFFVPYRLLWDNWEKFITNTPNPTVVPAAPFINVWHDGSNYTKLFDYFGIPLPTQSVGTLIEEKISPFAFAAYQFIFNEYYRDQNLIPEVDYKLVDGDNTTNVASLNALRKRAWSHDYFTGCLPFAQKGPAVDIPLGQFQDVAVRATQSNGANGDELHITPDSSTPPFAFDDINILVDNDGNPTVGDDRLYIKGSDLVDQATTINDLRRAFKLQEWFEKLARGGSRYIEQLKSFFGVRPEDFRLQRPEYITGVKSPIIISEVLNTTGTDDLPQANMAGHGVGVQTGKYGFYNVKEHGCIIAIASILPRTAYQQGIHRSFLKFDPFEYFWPQFANIGEQPVYNRELMAFNTLGSNTFGYIPRYGEYKFMPSRVAGDFRTSLDFWHMGRIFGSQPALNADFVSADPTDRIFNVLDPSTDHCYVQILHKIRAIRPMPFYGTPTI